MVSCVADGREIFMRNLEDHKLVLDKMAALSDVIAKAGAVMSSALAAGGRVFFCGNGGSAADAQHLAAELSGRYLRERRPLDGIALHCNTSAMTAIANDYSFDKIFARQLEAHGRQGDVLVAISTSGNSANIIEAAKEAHRLGMSVIGMTGADGGKMKELADMLIAVPSAFTPRIQEMHIMAGHAMCEMVEDAVCQ